MLINLGNINTPLCFRCNVLKDYFGRDIARFAFAGPYHIKVGHYRGKIEMRTQYYPHQSIEVNMDTTQSPSDSLTTWVSQQHPLVKVLGLIMVGLAVVTSYVLLCVTIVGVVYGAWSMSAVIGDTLLCASGCERGAYSSLMVPIIGFLLLMAMCMVGCGVLIGVVVLASKCWREIEGVFYTILFMLLILAMCEILRLALLQVLTH